MSQYLPILIAAAIIVIIAVVYYLSTKKTTTTAATGNGTPACTVSSDCPQTSGDQYCTSSGTCAAGCDFNSCGQGAHCNNTSTACVPNCSTGSCDSTMYCDLDTFECTAGCSTTSDCPSGQNFVCTNSKCVTGPPPPGKNGAPTGSSCTQTATCPPGQICTGGSCENGPTACKVATDCGNLMSCNSGTCGNPTTTCTENNDCDQGQYCNMVGAAIVNPTGVCANGCNNSSCDKGTYCNGASCISGCAVASDCIDSTNICVANTCVAPCTEGACGSGNYCATNGVCAPNPPSTAQPNYVLTQSGLIWVEDGASDYVCSGSSVANSCVLSPAAAQTQCNSDANCIGYIMPGNNPNSVSWLAKNPGGVQVITKAPIATNSFSDGTAAANFNKYYEKQMPTSVNSYAVSSSTRWTSPDETLTCPNTFDESGTYCIVLSSDAPGLCNTMSDCLGYVTPPNGWPSHSGVDVTCVNNNVCSQLVGTYPTRTTGNNVNKINVKITPYDTNSAYTSTTGNQWVSSSEGLLCDDVSYDAGVACIVDTVAAEDLCNTISGCIGYVTQPGGSWSNEFLTLSGVSQLYSLPLVTYAASSPNNVIQSRAK